MSQTVFITGVSSGIGHALTKEYLRRGDTVLGASRRKPQTFSQPEFRFEPVDLAQLGEIPKALEQLFRGITQLDVAILNAGVLGNLKDLGETPQDEIENVMKVNVWANKVILDTIFANGIGIRQVVAISSGASVHALRGWSAYSISKAALNMLTALYAAERPDTHFCALAPGVIETAMQEQISQIPTDERYPSIDMLKNMRGTPSMPAPEKAAPMLISSFERVLKEPSGSFQDVRTL